MALEFFNYRRITALVVSLTVILFGFVFFIYKLANVSVNKDYQKINSSYLKSSVKVFTNFYGIPYIYANNEEDLFFAVGYHQASVRLWQMDYYRRLSSGRLSEIFGKETIAIDKFMRCFDIEEISRRNYDSISGKSKMILDSYTKGVNHYIEMNSAQLPLEFNALNYKPAKWESYHSLMVGKFLTFELSLSIWADITFGEVLEKLGPEYLEYLLPNDEYISHIYKSATIPNEKNKSNFSAYSNKLYDIKDQLGIGGSSSGSNCWSYKNIDSTGAKSTVLANDAHLLLAAPSRWLQMKIKSPDIDAIGLTLPGTPLILSGRNNDIAWGVTNIMIDGFDYYLEKLDDKQENYFITDSTTAKLNYIVDTIKVANSQDEVYYKRKTKDSYLISDFHILSDSKLFLNIDLGKSDNALQSKNALSFKWIGSNNGDEIFALYRINTGRNYADLKDGLRHWSTPGLNFHYADKNGIMGVVSAGSIPKRGQKCNPNLPNPSWISDSKWIGVTKLSDSLFSRNNESHKFYASANNKLANNENIFVSNYWEPESRINRITELLDESDKYNYRDAQYMQNDQLSVYAREILGISIPILDTYSNLLTDEEKAILDSLKKWDFIMSRASVESSLYTFFYEKLIYNTFFDELGARLYKQYAFISSLATRKMRALLNKTDSPLFDIKGTKNIENKEFIVFKSFRDALQEFNSYFNEIPYELRHYGKMHTLTLEHALSKSKFLYPAVTLGPFEIGGNNTTINNAEWNINNPYKQVIGASMRIISDFSIDYIYTSLPGGISGDAMHPNYSDQLQIWLNGGYVKIPLDFKQSPDEFKLYMRFEPN